ncbi:MAG: histidine triad nucleotide-binding protein [Gemmatimonadaceae bacterium]
MAENDCLFCRIVRRELPVSIVTETEDSLAFRDINPQAPLHVLVIPKRHVATLDAADGDDDALMLGRLSLLAARIARDAGVADGGYRTVMNTNADSGQTVFHVHLHVLGGRRMGWPPG